MLLISSCAFLGGDSMPRSFSSHPGSEPRRRSNRGTPRPADLLADQGASGGIFKRAGPRAALRSEQAAGREHHPGGTGCGRLRHALHAAPEVAVGSVPRVLVPDRALQVRERLRDAALAEEAVKTRRAALGVRTQNRCERVHAATGMRAHRKAHHVAHTRG